MISVRDAQAHILERITAPVPPELLPLAASLGRVLTDDVRAEMDVPPTDNSAVDGYAVASADIPATGTRALDVVAELAAGSVFAGTLRFPVPSWNDLRTLSPSERAMVMDYFRRLNASH